MFILHATVILFIGNSSLSNGNSSNMVIAVIVNDNVYGAVIMALPLLEFTRSQDSKWGK